MANSSIDDEARHSVPASGWPPLGTSSLPGPGRDTERLAVAAHLHLLLRRRLGRVTDIEWMARNDDYAREVVRLAMRDPAQPELVAMGQRLQALLPSAAAGAARPALPARPDRAAATDLPRYVRSLR